MKEEAGVAFYSHGRGQWLAVPPWPSSGGAGTVLTLHSSGLGAWGSGEAQASLWKGPGLRWRKTMTKGLRTVRHRAFWCAWEGGLDMEDGVGFQGGCAWPLERRAAPGMADDDETGWTWTGWCAERTVCMPVPWSPWYWGAWARFGG